MNMKLTQGVYKKEDIMGIDELITLDDGASYVLLANTVYDYARYFLASLVENDEPTSKYVLLKEINENNELFVEIVENEEILKKLLQELEQEIDSDIAQG